MRRFAFILLGASFVLACTRTPPSTDPPVEPSQATAAAPPPETIPALRETPPLLLRGAKVLTATGVTYERGDVLVRNGKIEAVGRDLEAPEGVEVIDLSGLVLTPGIIDSHSHLGVYASPYFDAHSDGNEMVSPNTAYARAGDAYWPQDPQITRALAGGVTTMQVLPGSANLIGGRSLTVKLYPHARSAEDARFALAPYGLKMACGENPKRVYGQKGGPQTRMGNIAGFRNAFEHARAYDRKWTKYHEAEAEFAAKQAGKRTAEKKDGKDGEPPKPPDPPDRDFGLETLAAALRGEILVHNHCYRADEMLLMMALAEEYGFRIRSFHHAVEAYKIADRLAAHGAAASVWADWWGFKAEAFDGVRENAALVAAAGGKAIIHSDSATGIQRLNQEAAKAAFAGRAIGVELPDDEVLRWITANPAWALGIDAWVGTIEPGKHADLVVWNGTPFSVYAKALQVYIEGERVFDRDDPASQTTTDFEVGYEEAIR